MKESRHSKRLNITIPPMLLADMTAAQARLGLSRSGLIYFAVRDWIIKNAPPTPVAQHVGATIDPRRSFHDHLKPGMSADEMFELLELYEAARRGK